MEWTRRSPVILIVALFVYATAGANESSANPLPSLMLWAWERTEDLSFLDPATTGVAFHAAHLRIDGSKLQVKRRRHALRIPAGTPLLAVAHFSVSFPEESVIPKVRAVVLDLAAQTAVTGVEVDFEAVPSQRAFYRKLAADLRRHLPANYSLSATALASWCLGDVWLDPAPFDEVVPMFFDMGRAADREIRDSFVSGTDFGPAYCRKNVGLKVGDPVPRQFDGRRWYVFNPRPWTVGDYRKFTDKMGR